MARAVPYLDEKRYQAEQDARTLADAAVIKKDPGRKMAAAVAAKKLADDKRDELNGLRGVVKMGKIKAKVKAKVKSKGRP